MKKITKFLSALLLTLLSLSANAQISQDIIKVMNKCEEVMSNPAGVEMEIKLKTGLSVLSMNGTLISYSKGDKSFSKVSFKILGHELKSETGYDGKQKWEIAMLGEKNRPDTLYITQHAQKQKGEYDVNFGIYNMYKKGTMKVKGNNYELTFTEPKDKDIPKKTTMLINKSNYHFYQMKAEQSGIDMTLTASKIKFGVNDNVFKLDLNRYPDAKVIRK